MPTVLSRTGTFDFIERQLSRGNVIPVLGAGANLCDRPPGEPWKLGSYLPDARELAEALAREFPFVDPADLARVAMHIIAVAGWGPLIDELHRVFDADYPPTSLHRFLAHRARRVRTETGRGMLLVTTNYDDSLERAFREEGEPCQVVTYISDGNYRGYFRHHLSGRQSVVIASPTTYLGFRFEETSVIAKIHGAVRRTVPPEQQDRDWDPESYVIAEDQYIEYINYMHRDLFPVALGERLKLNHLLFLGYGLRDWNFRVMLHRIREGQSGRTYRSWAIEPSSDPIDQFAWAQRGVEILPASCGDFLREMHWKDPHEPDETP